MRRTSTSSFLWLTACGLITLFSGCGVRKSDTETGSISKTDSTTSEEGKNAAVPITTASDEARTLFTQGRALSEQLKAHDARQVLERAAAKDPTFALVHYQLALSSPTTKEFLQHLNEAVELSGKASEGERLMILSLQAGANADPKKSLEYAEKLVAKYPRDERAHYLLGIAYFGQQDFDKSIAEQKKATEINPSFSPAYNSLGYAYRPVGNNAEAEKAFKKYIQLVPNDPNPYDSYAELLMKTGRFDESIAQYRQALSIDPQFGSSRVGIAGDLMFQGKHDQAAAEAQKLYDAARDDGDRRTALLSRTVTYVDAGRTAKALQEMEKQYALGAKSGDTAAMSGDAVLIGDILLDVGRPDEARKHYRQALTLVLGSGLSADVKEDSKLAGHYNVARVALKKKDLPTAKMEAAQYMSGAEARHNDARIRQAHQLAGMIALQERNFDRAVTELAQGDQQNPYVLYLTAVTYRAKGDGTKAKELAGRAADMNTLPTLSYAFVREKAKQME
jgi:tetratricopeptide (TPR) repeat protein